MKIRLLYTGLLLFLLAGCQYGNDNTKTTEAPYVDFKRFSEGRPCSEVRFMCLPESQDKSWQEQNLSDGLDTFELTPAVMKRRNEIVQRWRDEEDGKVEDEDMRTAAISEAFYDRVEAKQFLVEMEQDLEKEFPGFWRDVPKKVRYRWIRRAMNKAKRFGYDPKQNKPMVELCARIGLDFDKDPKWDYITEFIKEKEIHVVYANRYVDWTIFDKKKDNGGVPITDWSMRRAIGRLPAPKKPYPSIND